MTHDCSETNQGEHVDHPKSWSACYHPSPVPSLHCWKQICQSKTPIKLTSCSLSDPLIKGKYPVYDLAFGSGVSSPQPCIILTLRGVLIWAWQDGKVVAFTALLRFLWRASALSVVCCLCRPHHPSQTPYRHMLSSQRMWFRPLSVLSFRMSCCLSAGEAFYHTERWLFRSCCAVVGSGSGPGDLAYREVINYSWKLSLPPGCSRFLLLLSTLHCFRSM